MKPRKPEGEMPSLTVPERLLLFCVASDTDWQKAGVTGATITAVVVKRLVDRGTAPLELPGRRLEPELQKGHRRPDQGDEQAQPSDQGIAV
jgi:hypothetical protein